MRKVLTALFLLALLANESYCQCCGAGNPINTVNGESTVKKGRLRLSLDYSHSNSSRYFDGTSESDYDFPGKVGSAGYDFMLVGAGYGITSKLSLQMQIGYYLNKNEDFISDLFPDAFSRGVGDLGFSIRHVAYRNLIKEIEVTPFIGLKVPVGKFDCELNGVKLPLSMQPSSGSFKYNAGFYISWSPSDKLSLQTYNYYEYSQRIVSKNFDYKYGDLIFLSISSTFRIIKNAELGLQLGYEYKGQAKDHGSKLYGTKYNSLKITPQLYFHPSQALQLFVKADFPVWQKTDGLQMVNSWVFQAGLSYNFKL